jgi:hypothetical protein
MGCSNSVPLRAGPQTVSGAGALEGSIVPRTAGSNGIVNLNRLPVDVCLLIRSYLIVGYLFEEESDLLETFLRQESYRAWTNFLSVSNHEVWREVRKSTMIWSLNCFESKKYFEDNSFKSSINKKLLHSSRQLSFQFKHLGHLNLELPKVFTDPLFLNGICCLSLTDCDITEIPSSDTLDTMSLYDCRNLLSLGNYPKLRSLRTWSCQDLKTIGSTESLTRLHLDNPQPSFFSLFPLEKLLQFTLFLQVGLFLHNSHRFHNLRELELLNAVYYLPPTMAFPMLPCPYLEKLTLSSFLSINISGLHSLRYLNLKDAKLDEIIGKEEIFPQLISFSFDGFMNEDISYFSTFNTTTFRNLRSLSLSTFATDTGKEIFHIDKKIQSLDLYVACIDRLEIGETLNNSRYFERISLSDLQINDVRMASQAQIVCLADCSDVTDISPLQNVPCLQLDRLTAVEDFSCLGKQKFLKISGCLGLNDITVNNNFSSIYSLGIMACEKITRIDNLTGNRYLRVHYCDSLRKVELKGTHYILVELRACSKVSKFTVSGKVYSLQISNLKNNKMVGLENCRFIKIED